MKAERFFPPRFIYLFLLHWPVIFLNMQHHRIHLPLPSFCQINVWHLKNDSDVLLTVWVGSGSNSFKLNKNICCSFITWQKWKKRSLMKNTCFYSIPRSPQNMSIQMKAWIHCIKQLNKNTTVYFSFYWCQGIFTALICSHVFPRTQCGYV